MPASQGILSHARDRNGDGLVVQLVAGPSAGALTLEEDGSFEYAPSAAYPGTDWFSYRLFDGVALSNVETVWLEAPPAPVARVETYSVIHDQSLLVAPSRGVLANDVLLDGRPLTARLISGVSHGTLVLAPDGSFDYRPAADFVGVDSFVYAADDGLASHAIPVTIQVTNAAPVATEMTYATHFGQPFVVSAAQGILSHVTDADGEQLTVTASAPAHGSVVVNADGSFLYIPPGNFVGTDTFNVHIEDGAGAFIDTVVTINVQNMAPTGQSKTYAVDHDKPLIVAAETGILEGAADADDDRFLPVNVTQPAFGVVTVHGNGAFTYVPALDFWGADSFTYQLSDGGTLSAPIIVTINVRETAPTATAESYSVLHDTVLFVPADAGILTHASDAESDPITFLVNAAPVNGGFTLFANGSFRYAPFPGFVGTDSFSFQLFDGLRYSDPIVATLNVTDNAPQTQGLFYTAKHSRPFMVGSEDGILSKFTDSDGEHLKATLAVIPMNGNVTVQETGAFIYTPFAGYHGFDSFGVNVNDGALTTFAWVNITVAESAPSGPALYYTVPHDTPLAVGVFDDAPASFLDNDGRQPETSGEGMYGELLNQGPGASTPPPATPKSNDAGLVVIGDVEAQQMPGLGARSTAVLLPLKQNLLGQVTDSDSDPFKVIAVTQPGHGTLQWNSIGSFVYVPAASYSGNDSFTYTVSDGVVNTIINVNLYVSNSAPSAIHNFFSVPRNGLLSVVDPTKGLLKDASDPDGDKLTAVVVQGPAQGTLAWNSDGTFRYKPNTGFSGNDSFTFKSYDGSQHSETKTVTLSVTNSGPTANAVSYAISPFSAANPAFFSNPDRPVPIPSTHPVSPAASYSVNTATAPVSGSDPSQGTQTLTVGLLANATDPNGDTLQLAKINGQDITGPTTLTLYTNGSQPVATTFTVNPNGTFTYSVPAGVLPFIVTQIPSAYFTFEVQVTFQYQVSDGSSVS